MISIPVEVLNPDGIHVTVKDDPLPLVKLPTHVVNNLTQDVRKQSVCPFPGVGIQHPVQVLLGQGLGVDHVGHALNTLQALQCLEEDAPGRRLAGAAGPHHHQPVVQVCDLVELQHFVHPGCALVLTLTCSYLCCELGLR